MNLDQIPTPESDVVWSEYLKSNYCTKDIEKLRKLHRDLERRLTLAREALRGVHETSSSSRLRRVAKETLTLTAPKA